MAKTSVTPCIQAKLTSLSPSREQYRPYLYNLEPIGVYVEIPVDELDIISSDKEGIVISLHGFTAMLDVVASSIEKMNLAHYQNANRKS